MPAFPLNLSVPSGGLVLGLVFVVGAIVFALLFALGFFRPRGRHYALVIDPLSEEIRTTNLSEAAPGIYVDDAKKMIVVLPEGVKKYVINRKPGWIVLSLGPVGLATRPDLVTALSVAGEDRAQSLVEFLTRLYREPEIRRTVRLRPDLELGLAVNTSQALWSALQGVAGMMTSGLRAMVRSCGEEEPLYKALKEIYAGKAASVRSIGMVIAMILISLGIMGMLLSMVHH